MEFTGIRQATPIELERGKNVIIYDGALKKGVKHSNLTETVLFSNVGVGVGTITLADYTSYKYIVLELNHNGTNTHISNIIILHTSIEINAMYTYPLDTIHNVRFVFTSNTTISIRNITNNYRISKIVGVK